MWQCLRVNVYEVRVRRVGEIEIKKKNEKRIKIDKLCGIVNKIVL